MGRMASAAALKGVRRVYEIRPQAGTKMCAVYDMFKQNIGLPIKWKRDPHSPRIVEALRDFYGLDIRLLQKGSAKRPSIYVLAGEWFGSEYRDYIAERIAD